MARSACGKSLNFLFGACFDQEKRIIFTFLRYPLGCPCLSWERVSGPTSTSSKLSALIISGVRFWSGSGTSSGFGTKYLPFALQSLHCDWVSSGWRSRLRSAS